MLKAVFKSVQMLEQRGTAVLRCVSSCAWGQRSPFASGCRFGSTAVRTGEVPAGGEVASPSSRLFEVTYSALRLLSSLYAVSVVAELTAPHTLICSLVYH